MSWLPDSVPMAADTAVTFVPDDGSDVIVFDDVDRRLHRLAGTAATIWAAIDGTRSASAVCQLVADVHQVPVDDITADVVAALDRLADVGIVRRR